MKDWKSLEVGDKVTYHWEDFDGCGSSTGTVVQNELDHIIVESDGMHLWLDDSTADMFDFEY